ncbi:hypothetical protein PHYC_00330 [Phycisphaerales bacterium]|nr:hypothetical protein PHYC_00330 [Phycisphaerales bacterium]
MRWVDRPAHEAHPFAILPSVRRLALNPRRIALFALGALLIGAALVPWGMNWLIVREIDFVFEARDAGAKWSLEWRPRDPARAPNGYWIDLAEFAPADARGKVTLPKAVWIHRRLPVYQIESISLKWHDSPGAGFLLHRVVETTRIIGAVRHRERPLSPRLPPRGAWFAAEDRFEISQPAGEVTIPPPARPFTDALIVWALTSGLVCVAAGVVRLAWRAACAATDAIQRLPRPVSIPRRHPVLASVAILATVGIPIWMFAWAPMLMGGDSVGYLEFADAFIRSPGIEHYNGWRLPGYAILLVPALLASEDFTVGIGILHCVLAILAPVLALAALRRRVSARWAWIGMLAIAADPMLIVWQRHVLAECTTTFLVMLLLWILVRFDDWCREKRPRFAALFLACALLGVLLAYCTLVRGNFQMALVLVPLFVGWSALRCLSWAKAAAVGAACLLAGSAVLAPFYVHIHRTFGMWGLAVGSGWHVAMRAWLGGTADWNQTGANTFEEVREIRRRIDERTIHEFIYADLIGNSQVVAVPPDVPFRRARDIRCAAAFRESRARLPDKFARLAPKAFVSLLGFPVAKPDYYRGFSFQLVRDLIGDPSEHATNLQFTHRIDPPEFSERIQDGVEPMPTRGSPNAAVLGAAWNAAWLARPAISILFLLAAAGFLRRRDIPMLAMSTIVLAHLFALPVLYYAGGDRYIMPWWGVSGLLVIAAVGARNPARQSGARPLSAPN